ncbi:hypothetical protein MMC25_006207 [Agyrium rufum]|nr:hypothetical protein [Agyrium rufum]
MVLNVIICGGGIAGPALAFWLVRLGHRVTVVERFPALRASGAQIDLRAQGIQVAKKMGLIEQIRSQVVDEDGIGLVDANGKIRACFMANKSGKGAQTFSSEYEIMRGDLVRVFYDATEKNVEYIFGKTVERFEQDEMGVTVHFSDGKTGTYDILVGADGQGSRVRKAILPPGEDPLRHMGLYSSHWSIPTTSADSKIAKGCHAPGGRLLMKRTHSPVESQAYFQLRDDSEAMRSMPKLPVEKQKEFWISKFKDAGWEAQRLIDGMQTSDYFYSQEIVQVRSSTWHQGRVVLVADAAHCPSPMTGMGTTSALAGTYVLAGEISKHPDDLELAFANYERILRPFVEEIQKLPMWILRVMLPESQFGISVLYFVLGCISYLRITELVARFSREEKGGWELPDYPLLNHVGEKEGAASS